MAVDIANVPATPIGGGGTTVGSGLTISGGVLTNDLLTGKAGGQTAIGGTAASENLTLTSTANGTKGKIQFGGATGLAYDEVNKRIGINNATPECVLHAGGATVGALALLGAASMPTVISLQSGAGTYPGIFFGSAASTRGALYFGDGTGIVLSTNVGTLDISGVTQTTISATAVQIKPGGTIVFHATTSGVFGTNTASGNLVLGSTSNATKGQVQIGGTTGLVYDETNKYLGVGVSPTAELHISKSAAISGIFQSTSGAATFQIKSGGAGNNAQLLFEISAGQDWMLGNKQSDGTFRISNSTTLGTSDVLVADTGRSVQIGAGSLAAAATAGFPYVPTIGASPSGAPGAKSGYVPFAYDATNNKLYVYNGAWKSVTLA